MTKRTIIPLLIAALVALLLPWFAVTFVKGDNGMAVIFLLFFAVNPITAVLLGIFSGGDVRAAWFQPLLFAALFLLGTWVFFTMAEMAFVLYAAAYLILGYRHAADLVCRKAEAPHPIMTAPSENAA